MKFIHTGDFHYGMNPDSDRPWSRERAQAVKDSCVGCGICFYTCPEPGAVTIIREEEDNDDAAQK